MKLGISKPPTNSTDLPNGMNMAIGCEPSELCCNVEYHLVLNAFQNNHLHWDLKKASLLMCKGCVNEI